MRFSGKPLPAWGYRLTRGPAFPTSLMRLTKITIAVLLLASLADAQSQS
jgi:hypothetical protein